MINFLASSILYTSERNHKFLLELGTAILIIIRNALAFSHVEIPNELHNVRSRIMMIVTGISMQTKTMRVFRPQSNAL